MNASSCCKSLALLVCLGFCLLAQAQLLSAELRPPGVHALQEQRLPGEPPPPFALKWGTNGTSDGEFDNPIGVAVDGSGNVYAADRGNFRIQKFDSSGTFITKWGSYGSGDGQFMSISRIAVDASGNVYVSDAYLDRIQKFDSSGTFLANWGASGTAEGQFDQPCSMAIDAAGNIYVLDHANFRVQKFDSSRNFILMWGWGVDTGASAFEICTSGCQAGTMGSGDGQFLSHWGAAVDASGNVYVGDAFAVQKFDSSGTFLARLGSAGSGDGQFNNLRGVAVDSSGNIYVVDTVNHRIQKLDSSGTFITKWGSAGSGDGQFDWPSDVAVDAAGNAYVADYDNDCIQKFGSTSERIEFITKWGSTGTGDGQFDSPWGVAVDASGNVYVADKDNHRIQKFDGSGTFLTGWGSLGSSEGKFNNPLNVAVDGLGYVYVVGDSRVQKFDSSGAFVLMWGWGVDTGADAFEICTSGCQWAKWGSGDGQFNWPYAIAIDAAGNVYVADGSNHRIQKFDSNGSYLDKWGASGTGDGEFDVPTGVAVDSSGNLYVTDRYNQRVQKFDSSGTFLGKWGAFCSTETVGVSGCDGGFYAPWDVDVDASGNVYVADAVNDHIQKFSSSGTFLARWGTYGTGDGKFDNPKGVAVDASGNVYVADTDNDRMQKFGVAYEALVYVKDWGSNGSGDGQFTDPRGPALDDLGNVYVADRGNQRIQKFDAAGDLLLMIGWGVNDGTAVLQTCTDNCQAGTVGGGAGQFDSPTDVALDSSGNIYVLDSLNNRIQKFDSSGGFDRTWGWGVSDGSSTLQVCTSSCQAGTSGSGDGQLNGAERFDVTSSGHVFVADLDNHRVQEFDGSGSFVRTFGWGVDDGSSALQVCTSGCQAGISGDHKGQFNSPEEVAVDSSGFIYVTDDNEQVQKFDSSAAWLDRWGTNCDVSVSGLDGCDGDFYLPYGLEVDESGDLLVADTSNHRIQIFSDAGMFESRWGANGGGEGQFAYPYGVAADSSGNVYVSDSNNHRIQKFSPCGFNMTPFSLFFASGPDSGGFSLDALTESCGWTATASHSWITIIDGSVGLGDGSVSFSVAANATAYPRGGTIAISDESTGGPGVAFSIIQDPAPCSYGLNPTTASFSGGAGADFVSLTSLPGCAWMAVSNDGWISVDAGAAGNGSGVVLYSVTANPGSVARAGSMTIGGQTFTVNQDPQVPDSPSNLACTVIGGTKTNVGLTWNDNAGNEVELRVERKTGASGTFALIATLPTDTTGYTDTGLEKNTAYAYRVMACNAAGCSAPSTEESMTTPALGVFIGEEEASQR